MERMSLLPRQLLRTGYLQRKTPFGKKDRLGERTEVAYEQYASLRIQQNSILEVLILDTILVIFNSNQLLWREDLGCLSKNVFLGDSADRAFTYIH